MTIFTSCGKCFSHIQAKKALKQKVTEPYQNQYVLSVWVLFDVAMRHVQPAGRCLASKYVYAAARSDQRLLAAQSVLQCLRAVSTALKLTASVSSL